MGYGGVVVERASQSSGGEANGPNWVARVMLGAGSADLTNPVNRTRITTDNFLVLEPTMSSEIPVLGRLTAGVLAGYRVVAGVRSYNPKLCRYPEKSWNRRRE
jgi:hypothetical protein